MDAKIPAVTKHFTFSSLSNSFIYDPVTKSEVYSQIYNLVFPKLLGLRMYLSHF